LNLESNDFTNKEKIPKEFTCDGKDLNPDLSWKDAPATAKSFALSVRDVDAPMRIFEHWLVYNIPRNVTWIRRGSPLPAGAKEVPNGIGKRGYMGPCPPSGEHRYFFRIYALDTERINCNNQKEFFREIKKHAITEAEIMGKYKRE